MVAPVGSWIEMARAGKRKEGGGESGELELEEGKGRWRTIGRRTFDVCCVREL